MIDLLILDIEMPAGEMARAEAALQRRLGRWSPGRNRLAFRLLRQGHLAGWADCLRHGRQVERTEVEGEMDGEVLELHRAQPTVADRPVPSLTVRIGEEIPDGRRLDETAAMAAVQLHRREGQGLAQALWSSLPGGTIDELTASLLRRRASTLRVSFGDQPNIEELEGVIARQGSRLQALARQLKETKEDLAATRGAHELWLRSMCRCEVDNATHTTNTSLCPVHGDPDPALAATEAANQGERL